ncbi:MAG: dihydroorotate dehydrogenase [Ezakiella sp.]|nr:dihydroorotate dehydrogenase [Ezakiella sp.]MDD7471488.1 dihydroorotate dehydrogenase [Bacillota bacterium]MDY3923690.1 dihydroorotate dehydrogenase [Ezakiella sp.]
MNKLATEFLGTTLKNPVLTASGTFGFGDVFQQFYDVKKLGGIIGKGLTLNPHSGNKGQRVWETASGMMNSIGLENPGVKHFIEVELPIMKKQTDYAIANLGGHSLEDYVEGASLLDGSDVDAIELNISCPNVKSGGMLFGIRCEDARVVVTKVRDVVKNKPLIVKLSPNAESVLSLAKMVEEVGGDAVSLVNTFNALAINVKTKRPRFENVTAGLSGPAIKPIALRMVYEVAKNVNIPVIGIGGIQTTEDALEFLMAGATLIEVGSANLYNPTSAGEIVDGLENYAKDNIKKNIDEIRGCIWR